MNYFYNLITFLFSIALIMNALAFIPQSINIYKNKSSKSISLITFSIFIFIQTVSILYGIIKNDWILAIGYLLALISCSSVLILALKYRNK
ncbi:SemiSWEET family sugar transporter [Francisella sp. TX07-6608]|uniref:SemiSWEET family sugar transporter n=1 Tax=Francisella sp. TX07-6608 TaxID=573568 RepID=UPI0009FDC3B1|nr:PQ-loop domain-containing transporter [Francisella sp. TX07-6608]